MYCLILSLTLSSTSVSHSPLTLLSGQDLPADTVFLQTSERGWSYAASDALIASLASHLQQQQVRRIAIQMPDQPELVFLLLAAVVAGVEVLPVSVDYEPEQLNSLLDRSGIDSCWRALPAVSEDQTDFVPAQEPKLLLLTSGTSGPPKCVRYLWRDLMAQVHKTESSHARWLLAYRLNHFAGIQVLCHVLVHAQTLLLPDSSATADAIATAVRFEATHISASPTFWRYALALPGVQEIHPHQITLGSEVVSEDLLARLRALYPGARLVHIYATTELGSCVSVADGMAGLPIRVLQRQPDAAVQFKVDDGELWVRALHGMVSYLDQSDNTTLGWRPTGDLVELTEERILFVGRRTEVINVGGIKVNPQQVEQHLQSLPEVQLLRAYGRENPITGQIVALDVVLSPGIDVALAEDRIFEAALDLPRHSRPRSVNFVDSLSMTNNKLERR